jgi:hypothetical protein
VTRETTKFENRPSEVMDDTCIPHNFNYLRANSITLPNNGILTLEQRIFDPVGSENSIDTGKINEISANP